LSKSQLEGEDFAKTLNTGAPAIAQQFLYNVFSPPAAWGKAHGALRFAPSPPQKLFIKVDSSVICHLSSVSYLSMSLIDILSNRDLDGIDAPGRSLSRP
jgi:hypothetical protein